MSETRESLLENVAEAAKEVLRDWQEFAAEVGLPLDEWPLIDALRSALSQLAEAPSARQATKGQPTVVEMLANVERKRP